MARQTENYVAPNVGDKFRVGADDWWCLFAGDWTLTTDVMVVTSVDDVFVNFDVYRAEEKIGIKSVNHCFMEEDFEVIHD